MRREVGGDDPELPRPAPAADRRISPTGCGRCWSTVPGWARFPDDVREWLEVQDWRSPDAGAGQSAGGELSPRRAALHRATTLSPGGTRTSRSGMLITKRMEERGLHARRVRRQRLRAGGVGAEAGRATRAPLLSPEILTHEFIEWVQEFAHAAPRVPRGGGDRRAGRAAASGQAQERQAGHLLDRPDLRRAAQVRARPRADRGRLGRCARADDRRRPARRPARHARPSGWSTSSSTGSARWRCRCW